MQMWAKACEYAVETREAAKRITIAILRHIVTAALYVCGPRMVSMDVVRKHAQHFEPPVRDELCRLMESSGGKSLVALEAALRNEDQSFSFKVAMAIVDSPFCSLCQTNLPLEDTPVTLAAKAGRLDVLEALLAKTSDSDMLDATDTYGWTALHWSVSNGHAAMTEFLLSKGANATIASSFEGATAMHIAAKDGDIEAMIHLLSKGASVNVRDKANQTPFHYGAAHAKANTSRYLLTRGADLEARDIQQNTPLHLAVNDGNIATATVLVQFGADVGAVNSCILRSTPLKAAAFNERVPILALLLGNGADIDFADGLDKDSALFLAAMTGGVDSIRLLVAEGASLTVTNASGDTPLQVYERQPDFGRFGNPKKVIEQGKNLLTPAYKSQT